MTLRDDTLASIEAGTLSRREGATRMHMTEARVSQLLKAKREGGPMPRERILKPSLPAAPPSPPQPAAPAPGSLDEALRLATGQPAAASSPLASLAGTAPPPAPPPRPALAYDPEDVAAARELMTEGRAVVVEAVAEYVYGIDSEDPELEPIKREGKLLKIALKRNPEKAAKMGSLFAGWPGLLVAAFIEAMTISRSVRKLARKKGLIKDDGGGKAAATPPPPPEVQRVAPRPPPIPEAPVESPQRRALRLMEHGA